MDKKIIDGLMNEKPKLSSFSVIKFSVDDCMEFDLYNTFTYEFEEFEIIIESSQTYDSKDFYEKKLDLYIDDVEFSIYDKESKEIDYDSLYSFLWKDENKGLRMDLTHSQDMFNILKEIPPVLYEDYKSYFYNEDGTILHQKKVS